MKIFTKNQLWFAAFLLATTVLFRFGLSALLEKQYFSYVWFFAAFYGGFVFAIGWVFGKKDRLSLPIYDIGFRFHATTYIICNAIAETWYLLGFQSKYEQIWQVHLTALVWGIALLLHLFFFFYTRKNSIQGLKKSDIFD